MVDNDNILADPEVVSKAQAYLLECLDTYVKENTIRDIDCLMIAHNFHRLIVKDIARRWEPEIPTKKTVQMADLTFRKAMRELR